jgi:hypothetical protein
MADPEPADGIFWDAVRREDAELFKSIKSWSKSSNRTRFVPFSLNVESVTQKLSQSLERIRSMLPRIGGQSFSVRGTDRPLTPFLLLVGRK